MLFYRSDSGYSTTSVGTETRGASIGRGKARRDGQKDRGTEENGGETPSSNPLPSVQTRRLCYLCDNNYVFQRKAQAPGSSASVGYGQVLMLLPKHLHHRTPSTRKVASCLALLARCLLSQALRYSCRFSDERLAVAISSCQVCLGSSVSEIVGRVARLSHDARWVAEERLGGIHCVGPVGVMVGVKSPKAWSRITTAGFFWDQV